MRALRIPALTLLALATAACSGDKPAAPEDAKPAAGDQREWTDAARIEAIASTLQACSYEGTPVKVDPGKLQGPAPGDCKSMVDTIMGYTGLPANFVVTAGPVPNAAAMILLDDARIPQRVIAFNPDFMRETQQATGGDAWAPVSIMAHEIGHHLSGHTITAGGSRPDIELEADKFSGYVLHKMGASLAAATKAILTLGTDTDQQTHPSKSKRAAAIGQGWQESCRQVGAANCSVGAGSGTAPVASGKPPVPRAAVTLPTPSPASIPFKYGQFVSDETGKLDRALVAEKQQQLYALARDRGAEIVYLVVNDLHGMQPDDYAWAMMRQLRVGKLDIGNGVVFVVAPRQKQVGVAIGPGIAKEAEFTDTKQVLRDWIDNSWAACDDADGCGRATWSLLNSFFFMTKWIEAASWTVDFQNVQDVLDANQRAYDERMRTKRAFDPKTDQHIIGRLLRFEATVSTLDPPAGIGQVNQRMLDASKVKYQPVGLTTSDGHKVIAYLAPNTALLMPSGALKVGQRYTLVGRLQSLGDGKTQATGVWLFSYERL